MDMRVLPQGEVDAMFQHVPATTTTSFCVIFCPLFLLLCSINFIQKSEDLQSVAKRRIVFSFCFLPSSLIKLKMLNKWFFFGDVSPNTLHEWFQESVQSCWDRLASS